jgi:hypothetical protein
MGKSARGRSRQRRDKGFGEVLRGNGEVCQDFAILCQKVWTKVWIGPLKVWIAPAKVVNRRSHTPEKCESLWIDGEVFWRGHISDHCLAAPDPAA